MTRCASPDPAARFWPTVILADDVWDACRKLDDLCNWATGASPTAEREFDTVAQRNRPGDGPTPPVTADTAREVTT